MDCFATLAMTARMFYGIIETTVEFSANSGQSGGCIVARAVRKSGVKKVTLSEWFEYRLENDPRFLRRIEQARQSLQAGRGVRLEDVETE
jgi:hypothetical protein